MILAVTADHQSAAGRPSEGVGHRWMPVGDPGIHRSARRPIPHGTTAIVVAISDAVVPHLGPMYRCQVATRTSGHRGSAKSPGARGSNVARSAEGTAGETTSPSVGAATAHTSDRRAVRHGMWLRLLPPGPCLWRHAPRLPEIRRQRGPTPRSPPPGSIDESGRWSALRWVDDLEPPGSHTDHEHCVGYRIYSHSVRLTRRREIRHHSGHSPSERELDQAVAGSAGDP